MKDCLNTLNEGIIEDMDLWVWVSPLVACLVD